MTNVSFTHGSPCMQIWQWFTMCVAILTAGLDPFRLAFSDYAGF
jgi:hypothetical protein